MKWVKDYMSKRWELYVSIIKSDSGVSSKSYVMVEGFKLGRTISIAYLILSILDYFKTGELDYIGTTALLGGLSALILASAWGKTKSEQAYWESYDQNITPPPNP